MKTKKIFLILFVLFALAIAMPLTCCATISDYYTKWDIAFDAATGTITGGGYNKSVINIPSQINGVAVTSIGDGAFSGCNNLTSISIPSSVTSIGGSAFYNCNGLTSITIPSSVTSIGDEAFHSCDNLSSITIPSGLTHIGYNTFSCCTSLSSITIPSSVTSIGNYAFESCESLDSVTIPLSVTNIGSGAFKDCSNLNNINVDENNKNYTSENGVLFDKDKTILIQYPIGNTRTSYHISEGITNIGDSAFFWCHRLSSIIIPQSVTSIGNRAFYGCDKVINITIPSSVTSIGYRTFAYCTGLSSVTIPSSVTSIDGYAFYRCDKLTDVYYNGSESDWGNIEISLGNEYLTNATIHYGKTNSETGNKESVSRAEVKAEKTITILKNKNSMTAPNDDYVIWAPVKVTVGDNKFYVKEDATVAVPKTGQAVISAEGFIDLTVDLSKISNGDTLYLEKSGMNTPILYEVMLNETDIRREKLTLESGYTGRIKANIDWNGNTESVVYIENGGSKWQMVDGQTPEIDFLKEYNPKRGTNIVIKTTNGFVVKKALNIASAIDASAYENINVSFGDSIKDINSGDIPYLDMKFKLDMPNFPGQFSIDGNKIKLIFGVDVAEWAHENNYYDGKKGEWTTKEKQNAFNSLSNIIKDTKKQMDKNKNDKKSLAQEYKELKKQLGKSQKFSTAKFGFDANMSFVGYAEGTIDQNGLFLSDGGFIFSAEAAAGFSGQFTIWVIPFNWEAELKGAIEAQLAIVQQEIREQSLKPVGKIGGSVGLSAGVGPGMKKLHANLCGEGAIKPAYELSEIKNAFTLDAELGLSIEVVAWRFSKSFELAKKDFHLYPKTQSKMALMSESDFYDTIGYELVDRGYLDNPSAFVANDDGIMLMSVTPQTKTETEIKRNVYKANQPVMVGFEDDCRLLVWVDDDTSRSALNGTSLAYTYFDGTTWSDEQFVENDGTADFNPQLKDVNGKVYLVWENEKSVLPDNADISDMAKATEIKYAVYNERTNKFVNITALTNNNYIDSEPQISATDEGAVISWITNTSNDVFTANNCHNISYALVNGSTIKENKVAVSNISAIDSHSAYIKDGVQISYIADTDGDINTSNDNKLYSTNGSIALDGIPSGIAEYFGKYYCYNNGVLSISDNGYTFTDTTLALPNDRFIILDNGNMVCYEHGDGAIKDIYAYIFDESLQKWSKSIRLTDLEANLSNISGYVDENDDVHFAFNKGIVTGDFSDNIDTLFGQYDLSTLNISPSYNITVDDVYITEETIVENYPVEIAIDVTNNGEKTIDKVDIAFYDENDNELMNVWAGQNILPGETATLHINYTIPSDFEAFNGAVRVTPSGKTDFDISDNEKTIAFDYIDLCIDNVSYAKNSDNTLMLNVLISNLSLDTQNNVVVSLMDGENVLESKTISNVSPLNSESVSFGNIKANKTYTIAVNEIENENIIANNYQNIEISLIDSYSAAEGYIDNIAYSNGTLITDVTMFNSDSDANAYVAVYDDNSNLVALQNVKIPEGTTGKQLELDFIATKEKIYNVRLMLWNNLLSPFMNVDEKEFCIE